MRTSFIKKLKTHIWVVIPFALLIGLLLTTNPQHLPLAFLIVPFILLFICMLLIFLVVLKRLTAGHQAFAKKQFAVAAVLAFLPSLLLILQSINQLTLKDVLILSVLIGSIVFYISKLSFTNR